MQFPATKIMFHYHFVPYSAIFYSLVAVRSAAGNCFFTSDIRPMHYVFERGMSVPGSSIYPIYLTYLNGTALCFNADDYMKIRSQHRIVGSLIGTCNSRGWTPGSFSIPAEFNCYETRLLIEKGFAILLSKESLNKAPTKEEQESYKSLVDKRIDEQITHLKNGKIADAMKNVDKIITGKREKLLRSGVDTKDINIGVNEVLAEVAENFIFDKQNALIDIPCQHPFPHEGSIVKLSNTEMNSLKYDVFRDLWERGMYVTSGEAFGADFIAYPGDPLIFHASHIVIILDDPTKMSPIDLISKGRLAVIVNKVCMFAYYRRSSCSGSSESKSEISYQILQWEGCKENTKTSLHQNDIDKG